MVAGAEDSDCALLLDGEVSAHHAGGARWYFARILEAQNLSEELLQEECMAEVEVDNVQCDALLTTDEAQTLLEKLADEALAEHRAGKTRPMVFGRWFMAKSAFSPVEALPLNAYLSAMDHTLTLMD